MMLLWLYLIYCQYNDIKNENTLIVLIKIVKLLQCPLLILYNKIYSISIYKTLYEKKVSIDPQTLMDINPWKKI